MKSYCDEKRHRKIHFRDVNAEATVEIVLKVNPEPPAVLLKVGAAGRLKNFLKTFFAPSPASERMKTEKGFGTLFVSFAVLYFHPSKSDAKRHED